MEEIRKDGEASKLSVTGIPDCESAAVADDGMRAIPKVAARPAPLDDTGIGSRIRRAIKERGYLGLCFIVPALIMWLIYISMSVFPFGEESVLVLDLNGQYVYYFEALRDILTEGGSLLYSFRRALGGEFLGIIGYYLASPLSLIVALFPKRMITEALLCIFLLKAGLSGLTFGIYLDRRRKKNPTVTVMFSLMYALSAYAVVMQHNTMWIDNLYLLPLILLGVEELICRKKYKLFVITLSLAAFSNFYIGYMTCIFTALYFFYYYYSRSEEERNPIGEKNHLLRSIIRAGLCALLMVCICAVMLWSSYTALKFGKTEFTNPDYGLAQNFDFLDLVSKLYFGSYDTVRPEGWPFVYSGMLTFMLFPLFFFVKKIPLREKIATALFVAALFLCFNTSTVDIFWHGMQRPNWLNYRYSYMVCFILIVMAHRVFESIDELGYRPIIFSACTISGILLVLQKLDYENLPDLEAVWASLAFLMAYLLVMKGVTFPVAVTKRTATLILTIFVGFEMYAAGLSNLMRLDSDVVYTSRTTYRNHMDTYDPAFEKLQEYDTSFYRSEKVIYKRTNDNLAQGVFGLSNSTSTLNANTISFLQSLGLASKSHWSKYLGSTPATDTLLGIKYLAGLGRDSLPEYYSEVFSQNGVGSLESSSKTVHVYNNPYAMSVVFGASEKITEVDLLGDDSELGNPFERLNSIYASLIGTDSTELFVNLKQGHPVSNNLTTGSTTGHVKYYPVNSDSVSYLTYDIVAETDDVIYMYIPSTYPRECNLTVNGASKGTYFGNETHRIVELGSYEAGQELTIKLELNEDELYISTDDSSFFYYFDDDVYRSVAPMLKGSEFNITEWTEDTLSGSINVSEGDELIFTTIPYDEGWKVTADGKEIETFKVLDSLIAFRLPVGEHSLEMKYRPDCAVYGSIVSIAGIVIFAAVCVAEHVIKKKRAAVTVGAGAASSDLGASDTELPEADGASATFDTEMSDIPDADSSSEADETSEAGDTALSDDSDPI